MESNVRLEEGSYNPEPARKSSNKRIVKKGKAGRERNAQQYMKNMMLPRSQRKSAPIKGTGKHGNRFTKHVSGSYMGEEAINEVKIGDDVTFTHNKKKVTGKVIYRHDSADNKKAERAALMGHVNVQIHGDESYPVTVHVSKLKPALKEERNMDNINEQILDLIDNIDSGNHIEANNIFNALLQQRIDDILGVAKEEVAKTMFNTQECAECDEELEEAKKMKNGKGAEKDEEEEDEEELEEALKGNQHKIDANKNGKLDAQDFKMLRAKKGMKKEETTQEAYSDPYAAKKAAEMKKAHASVMADAKKEYDAAKKTKFAKNFMKMKEEAGVEEAVVIKPTSALQSAIDAYKKKKQQATTTVPKTRETPAVKVGK